MDNVINWISDNQTLLVTYAVKIVVAILILVIGKFIANAIANMMSKGMRRKEMDNAVISFLSGIIKALIFIAAILMALSHVGVQTTSFIAILGAAGLAVGLALQGSLSNIASGVLIIMFRPFRAGEYVEAGGVAGTVDSINVFQTVMKTPDRKVVFVPNSQITSRPITNYNREPLRRIDLVIGVSYSANLSKTKDVLMQCLKEDERILAEPEPVVTVTNLNASSVDFNVRPWVKGPDYWPVRWDLLEKIKNELDANGIGIPFPQMDVHLFKQEQEEKAKADK
ncbi:mechanosensitive ion channel domain-containing protein [Idiomarina xiamenensis]|uniref:Small-conductance mechanosensitive channel n=1 Tax=Idiomarina xiamenensis 10-D-4 TaxID=740709 RepID=K2KS99_9GAMM|nr:mechanosensitive ion channel domain-containing protein [Idiomarina xiamenensis]EKE85209.1 small-conductance mechanosensitive channel [Idiomarina xiamenensis 10-D-4]